METPRLEPIKGGWAALAERWGVHGATQEEALKRFGEAEIRHREIDARIQAERDAGSESRHIENGA